MNHCLYVSVVCEIKFAVKIPGAILYGLSNAQEINAEGLGAAVFVGWKHWQKAGNRQLRTVSERLQKNKPVGGLT